MSARPKVPLIARTLLGLAFLVFGLNFFLRFLPEPVHQPEVMAFFGALMTGKIMTIVKVVEIGAAVLLLSNRFVPLALTLLAPVEIGILAFHGVFDPGGLPVIGVLAALTIYLAWSYRAAFAPMLQARVEPTTAGATTARHPVTA